MHVHGPLEFPRKIFHVGDQASIEGHQQRAATVIGGLIGQIQGTKDRQRRFSASGGTQHDRMPLRRKLQDLLLSTHGLRKTAGHQISTEAANAGFPLLAAARAARFTAFV